MIRRWLIGIAAALALGAAGWLATAVAQSPHVVKAVDPAGDPPADDRWWEPGIQQGPAGTIEVETGDTVSFEFDQAGERHNLLIQPPSGDWVNLSEGFEDCEGTGYFGGRCPPDTSPITYEFEDGAEEGTYVYFCTLHGGSEEGTSGMSGRIVLGEGNGGPEALPNLTESPGPPWEAGTEPPKLRNVLVRGVRRGVRLRARLTHPSKLVVRMRKRGRVVLTRRLRNLPEGVVRKKIRSNRLRSGRYRVVIRGRDRWGIPTEPQVIRDRVRVRY